MNVLHVTPSFYPATYYGGPIRSTYGLCNALSAMPDVQLRVLTTDTAGLKRRERLEVRDFPTRINVALPDSRASDTPASDTPGYDVYYCKRWLGADVAPGLFLRLWPMIRWANVVHLTAVYSPPTIPTLFLSRLLGKPVVWSTRGALQRWSESSRPMTKTIWEKLCNALCSKRVVLHATSDAEAAESGKRIPKCRTVVIPNGVDLPEPATDKQPSSDGLRLLYLGRLDPIKGIENLLRALTKTPESVALDVCGDGHPNYVARLKTLTAELSLSNRVTFLGRVDDDNKERHFKAADWCVVPSFKENFCIVVAEALAHGIPVITSRGTPWQQVEETGCGLWVENDETSLAEAIKRASKMQAREMGRRGRDWMKRDFGWAAIAEQMAAQYRELIDSAQSIPVREKIHRQAA